MINSEGNESSPMAATRYYFATAARSTLFRDAPPPQLLLQSPIRAPDPSEHIKVSCFYEIDHSMLPSRSPDQLKCVRVVMVNEKTRMRVSLRYPSIYSLQAYFSDGTGFSSPELRNIPALDEKFIIGSEVAADALYRRIIPAELAERKWSWSFWVVSPIASSRAPIARGNYSSSSKNNNGGGGGASSSKGSLLSELKTSRIVDWGLRRRVRFLGRHVEEDKQRELTEVEEDPDAEFEEQSREEEDDDEDEEDDQEERVKSNLKRKRNVSSSAIQLRKRPKRRKTKTKKKQNQIVVYKQKKVLKNSIDRWSAQRYKLAEENMLKIMKEAGVVFGNPMMRADLREKARKLIGDTGLLDHLLKHMAGKVAPGGEERFRRRHNAEGSMEYWLEKADLMDVRKEAGVADPYWVPPPGWKPGDNPSQNPVCASQIKELRQHIEKLQRDVEAITSCRKMGDDRLAIVTTPISSVTTTLSNIEHDDGFLIPLKEMYIDLSNKKARIEEQMSEISNSLCAMEEATAAARRAMAEKGSQRQREELRAEKIERLKSGFRICNPGGSFLWPNIATPVQLEGALLPATASTPSSASSCSAAVIHPPQYSSSPPVMRPLAERRAISLPSILRTPGSRTPLINLNEEPSGQNDAVLVSSGSSQSQGQISSCPVTYHRRNHHPASIASSTLAGSSKTPVSIRKWLGVGSSQSSGSECKRG